MSKGTFSDVAGHFIQFLVILKIDAQRMKRAFMQFAGNVGPD